MLQIGDIVGVSSDIMGVSINTQVHSAITSMRLENQTGKTTTVYGLDGRYATWPEEHLILVGRQDDIPPQPYRAGDKVYIQNENRTVYTIGTIRHNPNGYKYELYAKGSSRYVSEHQIVSAEPYTLF